MRTTPSAIVALLLGVFVTTAAAQNHEEAMGVWVLNVQKSVFSPAPLPKTQTSTFTMMPDGAIKIANDSVDQQGTASHREMVSKFDGKQEARTGGGQPTTRAYRWLDDRNFAFEEMVDGKPTVTGRTTTPPDGRVRTLTVAGTRNGQPVHNVEVYERQSSR